MAAEDTVTTDSRHVACDGGGGPQGHPRVFLTIEGDEKICPYCSRRFVLAEEGRRHGGGH
ncbi:MAG: zinc-finger domain-containing protein [Magnetospirillum sp. WYHS-4]